MPAALAVQRDHAVDDVSAVNASQGKDSASSLVDNLGHSQTATASALHNLSFTVLITASWVMGMISNVVTLINPRRAEGAEGGHL
jgi:hypothetical protein